MNGDGKKKKEKRKMNRIFRIENNTYDPEYRN